MSEGQKGASQKEPYAEAGLNSEGREEGAEMEKLHPYAGAGVGLTYFEYLF